MKRIQDRKTAISLLRLLVVCLSLTVIILLIKEREVYDRWDYDRAILIAACFDLLALLGLGKLEHIIP